MTIVGAAWRLPTHAAPSKAVSPCQRIFPVFERPCIANHNSFRSERQILASLSDFDIRICFGFRPSDFGFCLQAWFSLPFGACSFLVQLVRAIYTAKRAAGRPVISF